MSDESAETLADKERRIAELDREIAINRISRETGVPLDLLGRGRTAEEIEQIAADAIAWRAAAPPAPTPTTSAVPTSRVGQIGRNTLPYLSPADTRAVWRQGRLEDIGAPAPPPHRNGA